MKHLLFSILFLLPWSVNAQTVGTVPATQVEILKAEAAKKAKEAKEAAEKAKQAAEEALKAAELQNKQHKHRNHKKIVGQYHNKQNQNRSLQQ